MKPETLVVSDLTCWQNAFFLCPVNEKAGTEARVRCRASLLVFPQLPRLERRCGRYSVKHVRLKQSIAASVQSALAQCRIK